MDDVISTIFRHHQQLRRLKDETGRNVTDDFKKLPNKEEDPKYYKKISRPISFLLIRNRIDKQKYASVSQWIDDVEQLITNVRLIADRNADYSKFADIMQNFLDSYVKEEKIPTPSSLGDTSKVMSASPLPLLSNKTLVPMVTTTTGSLSVPGTFGTKPGSVYISPSQIKFFPQGLIRQTVYQMGDSVYLRPQDETEPALGRIYRYWKGPGEFMGVLVSLFIRPKEISISTGKEFENVHSNEVFATSHFRVYFAADVLEKVSISFPLVHAYPDYVDPEKPRFVCKEYFDISRGRFYSFYLTMDYLIGLQVAIDTRKRFRNDSRKVYCTYLTGCDRTFNLLDGLVKHSAEHIAQLISLSIPFVSSTDASSAITQESICLTDLPKEKKFIPVPFFQSQYTFARRTDLQAQPSYTMSPHTSTPAMISLPKPSPSSDYPIQVNPVPVHSSSLLKPVEISSDLAKSFQLETLLPGTQMIWFAGPPLSVASPSSATPIHSLEYLEFKNAIQVPAPLL